MRTVRLVGGFLLLVAAPLVAWAQTAEPPPGPPGEGPAPAELREAMRQFFQNRLRAELGLTDEQMRELAPALERMEQHRLDSGRRRGETLRELQRGMREGASDAELQALLDRLEADARQTREQEQALFAEIDKSLTVRQRVQFRFFTERFRQELERRVREWRDRNGERESLRRPPPPRERP